MKEKIEAQELYNKFLKIIKGKTRIYLSPEQEKRLYGDKAKKCSLQSIDLLYIKGLNKYSSFQEIEYWDEVKKQIKKL